MVKHHLHNKRKQYSLHTLNLLETPESPFLLFESWFLTQDQTKTEPNAMILSTVSKKNIPSARVVLLKSFDEDGFTFYTNYKSKKGKNIKKNPNVSLLFFYEQNQRQIRIQGTAKKLSSTENDKYFYSRPIESQYSAILSSQSSIIESKKDLESQLAYMIKTNTKAIRPKNWGGYIVKPSYFEFWQGRPNRLHDRVVYKKQSKAKWLKEQLAP